MNVLIFNYSHPDLPHISAKRMSCFAKHLAERGHRVVLITKTPDTHDADTSNAQIKHELPKHDWHRPFVLAVQPQRKWALTASRVRHTPPLFRRALLLGFYLFKDGRSYFDWSDQVIGQFTAVGQFFKPDIAWGTFGNIDTLWLTKQAAHHFKIPYVIDIKDPWRYFIPVFRKRLAAQFSDAAGITVNSLFQATHSLPWFSNSSDYKLLYSGVDDLIANTLPDAQPDQETELALFNILIVGSIYDNDRFIELLMAIDRWTIEFGNGHGYTTSLTYAGADSDRVNELIKGLSLSYQYTVYPFLPYRQLYELYHRATAITYIHNPKTFHHKLIELLAFNRPLIAYPDESPESLTITAKYNGTLSVCKNDADILATLKQISLEAVRNRNSLNQAILADFNWRALSQSLEHILYQLKK